MQKFREEIVGKNFHYANWEATVKRQVITLNLNYIVLGSLGRFSFFLYPYSHKNFLFSSYPAYFSVYGFFFFFFPTKFLSFLWLWNDEFYVVAV